MRCVTSISREEVERVEVREIIATVDFNGFQETHRHPQPDHDQMVAQQKNANEEPSA